MIKNWIPEEGCFCVRCFEHRTAELKKKLDRVCGEYKGKQMRKTINDYTAEELQAELKRREEAAKKTMVTVRCPVCSEPWPEYAKSFLRSVGVPVECTFCNGTKQLQAELIESK